MNISVANQCTVYLQQGSSRCLCAR